MANKQKILTILRELKEKVENLSQEEIEKMRQDITKMDYDGEYDQLAKVVMEDENEEVN